MSQLYSPTKRSKRQEKIWKITLIKGWRKKNKSKSKKKKLSDLGSVPLQG
jgi:hypothetical protein